MSLSRCEIGELSIGVIGCGAIARAVHLPVLARLEGVRVTALVDPTEAALLAAARLAPGARQYQDYRESLAKSGVDAVVIAAPSALHAEISVAAFEAGKHVYLEKPLATNLSDTRTVLNAWKASGRVGMIGFNYRFHPLYQEARRLVARGRIGRVAAVRMVFSTKAHSRPDWADPWFELAAHEIDLARFVLGEDITEASAWETSCTSKADTITIECRTTAGVLIQGFFSLGSVEDASLECYGSAGKLVLGRYRNTVVELWPPAALGVLGRVREDARQLARVLRLWRKLRAPAQEPSYREALKRFATSVANGEPVSPDLDDGYRCLCVSESARAASRENRSNPVV